MCLCTESIKLRNISVIGDSEVYRLTGVSWVQAEQITDMEVRMTNADFYRRYWHKSMLVTGLRQGRVVLWRHLWGPQSKELFIVIAVSKQSRKILLRFFPYLSICVPTCRTLAPPVMYWAERCVVSALLRPTFVLLILLKWPRPVKKSRCGFSLSLALSVDNDFRIDHSDSFLVVMTIE